MGVGHPDLRGVPKIDYYSVHHCVKVMATKFAFEKKNINKGVLYNVHGVFISKLYKLPFVFFMQLA